MLAVLSIVLPVFAIVLAGAVCRWLDVLGETASRELNRFVVYLALPALLFRAMAEARFQDLAQPGFAIAFAVGLVVVFAMGAGLVALRRGNLGAAAFDGLNAGYANTAYLGIPLTVGVFGPDSLTLITIATLMPVCILLTMSIAMIEISMRREGGGWAIARDVGLALARNPLIIAPALGTLYAALLPPLPAAADRALDLVGGAASPCALVALGLFFAERRIVVPWASVAPLIGLKLVVQPLVTWTLAVPVFGLPPEVAGVAIMLAAMPTGTGPFMLAALYGREAGPSASTVLVSTVLSLVTLPVVIVLLTR